MLMMSKKKNLDPQGDFILRNEVTKSDQGKILRRNCWPTPKLERPHINGITQIF